MDPIEEEKLRKKIARNEKLIVYLKNLFIILIIAAGNFYNGYLIGKDSVQCPECEICKGCTVVYYNYICKPEEKPAFFPNIWPYEPYIE